MALGAMDSLFGLGSLMGGQTVVGLSIGSSSIKIVELKKANKGWKLAHFGMVQLPEDAIVNREIINQIAVVDSLKTLVAQLKLKTRNICTSISGTSVMVKRMSLDVPNLRELQEQVFWEAEQYLPFDVTEVVMDYQMLSRAKDNRTDVMLVAAKRTMIENYMACVSDAGLNPKIVDVDYFALQNVFEANYPINPSEAVCLVDLGASSIKMVVIQSGLPIFTKEGTIGGRNLTMDIQKTLNLPYVDAESLKVGGSTGGMPQEVSDLMAVASDNFATELKRALDFYNASSSGAPVAYVLLMGGSAKIPNLARVIEETCGIPAQIANPFNSISYDPEVFTNDYMEAIGPIAAIPIGLALRAGAQ